MLLSSRQIKAEAASLGFSACGLARAEAVDRQTADAFSQWLSDGCQAGMEYMKNNGEKRLNPQLLVEGAQTVVSVALNYYPPTQLPTEEYQLAWYAYGKDYHDIMKAKLYELFGAICRQMSVPVAGRVFCDTAPLLERYWAQRAGLGWIGKNTQLIIPHAGSCFFLGEILLDIEADRYDSPLPNRCGTCHRCLDACPTKALGAPFRLSAERCLSYLTIEHRGDIPADTAKKMGKKIYGCDECQRACPWNRFAQPCQTTEFHPSPALLQMTRNAWQQLTEEQYRQLFKGSAVKRAKYAGLMRNIKAASEGKE